MRLTFVALAAFVAGCGPSVGETADGSASSSTGGSDATMRPGTSETRADASDDPAPGFDSKPDVGDGTLAEPLLLVARAPEGWLYFWWDAERLGDTLQGSLGPAKRVDSGWVPAGHAVWAAAGCRGNRTSLSTVSDGLPISSSGEAHGIDWGKVVTDHLPAFASVFADVEVAGRAPEGQSILPGVQSVAVHDVVRVLLGQAFA